MKRKVLCSQSQQNSFPDFVPIVSLAVHDAFEETTGNNVVVTRRDI